MKTVQLVILKNMALFLQDKNLAKDLIYPCAKFHIFIYKLTFLPIFCNNLLGYRIVSAVQSLRTEMYNFQNIPSTFKM